MEKRRRDRINTCLDNLASLLLASTGSTSSSSSSQSSSTNKSKSPKNNKLEKADILEQTVRYWHQFVQDDTKEIIENENNENSFLVGYRTCAGAVDLILEDMESKGEDVSFRTNLQLHLEQNIPSEPFKSEEQIVFMPKKLQNGDLALIMTSQEDLPPLESEDDEEDSEDVWRPW